MSMTTGEKIRLLRLSQNLTQTALAEMVGLNVSQVSVVETNRFAEWEQQLLTALGYTPALDPFLEQMANRPAVSA